MTSLQLIIYSSIVLAIGFALGVFFAIKMFAKNKKREEQATKRIDELHR